MSYPGPGPVDVARSPRPKVAETPDGVAPPRGNGKRTSEPRSWTPYLGGGAGLIARRAGQDPAALRSADALERWATKSPMQVLAEMPALHPSVGMAQWNALRLMFPECDWGWRAKGPDGTGDDAGDAAIAAFHASMPREQGGPKGVTSTLTSSLLFTGMACVECVPFAEGDPRAPSDFAGLRRAWPVDSLTIAFGRYERDDDLTPFQKQSYPSSGPGRLDLWTGNWVPLSTETFFWTALDCQVDDPYGLAPYASAVNEVLADLALMRDLRDAVHNAAWPRLDVGVNLAELHRVAVEVYRITEPKKASQWVKDRFNEIVAYVEGLAPDDNLVHDTSGKVETKQPGSFTGLEGVLSFLRQRLVQALKSLPTLLGINDGSTFNYTSVEWAIYAAGLEALRSIVMDLWADVLSLHLRLTGSASRAYPYAEKIRTNDALVEANTEEVRIRNSAGREALGYDTHDQAAESVTGRAAVKEADPEVLNSIAGAKVAKAPNDPSQRGNAGQGANSKNQGASQEERQAAGRKK